MGAYSLDTLLRKWGRGELTVEQVLGQILLHLQGLEEAVEDLERWVHRTSSRQGNASRRGHRPTDAGGEDKS